MTLLQTMRMSSWSPETWSPTLGCPVETFIPEPQTSRFLIINTKIWNLNGQRQSSTSLSFSASVKLNAMHPLKMVEIPLCWPGKIPWCSTWEKGFNTACMPWAPLCKNSQALSTGLCTEWVCWGWFATFLVSTLFEFLRDLYFLSQQNRQVMVLKNKSNMCTLLNFFNFLKNKEKNSNHT